MLPSSDSESFPVISTSVFRFSIDLDGHSDIGLSLQDRFEPRRHINSCTRSLRSSWNTRIGGFYGADSVNPYEDSRIDLIFSSSSHWWKEREWDHLSCLTGMSVTRPWIQVQICMDFKRRLLSFTYFHNLVEVESSAGDGSCNLCAHFPWWSRSCQLQKCHQFLFKLYSLLYRSTLTLTFSASPSAIKK